LLTDRSANNLFKVVLHWADTPNAVSKRKKDSTMPLPVGGSGGAAGKTGSNITDIKKVCERVSNITINGICCHFVTARRKLLYQ
jgi:hypothetical protein